MPEQVRSKLSLPYKARPLETKKSLAATKVTDRDFFVSRGRLSCNQIRIKNIFCFPTNLLFLIRCTAGKHLLIFASR